MAGREGMERHFASCITLVAHLLYPRTVTYNTYTCGVILTFVNTVAFICLLFNIGCYLTGVHSKSVRLQHGPPFPIKHAQ